MPSDATQVISSAPSDMSIQSASIEAVAEFSQPTSNTFYDMESEAIYRKQKEIEKTAAELFKKAEQVRQLFFFFCFFNAFQQLHIILLNSCFTKCCVVSINLTLRKTFVAPFYHVTKIFLKKMNSSYFYAPVY